MSGPARILKKSKSKLTVCALVAGAVLLTAGPVSARDAAVSALQSAERSCAAGNGAQCLNLGDLRRDGRGYPRDYKEAAFWYAHGCAAGNAASCANLGFFHQAGLGVKISLPSSVAYLKKACTLRDAPACAALGRLAAKGQGLELDEDYALYLYKRACRLGHLGGCTGVAGHYLDNDPGRSAEAVALLDKVCLSGHGDACNLLGSWYERQGLSDAAQLGELYAKACRLRSLQGCVNQARLGRNTPDR